MIREVPGEGFLKEMTFVPERGRFWRKGLLRRGGRESGVKWPQKSGQSTGPAISGLLQNPGRRLTR